MRASRKRFDGLNRELICNAVKFSILQKTRMTNPKDGVFALLFLFLCIIHIWWADCAEKHGSLYCTLNKVAPIALLGLYSCFCRGRHLPLLPYGIFLGGKQRTKYTNDVIDVAPYKIKNTESFMINESKDLQNSFITA